MKLLIDDADIQAIRSVYEYYPVDGVTTNPSILARVGLSQGEQNPYALLREIRAFIGADAELHVQAVSRSAEGMVEEGIRIAEVLGKNTFIKIPAVREGLKAIRILADAGYHVTATAIYTPQQAFLAGKAGADYAAPYVNRIDNMGLDGVAVTKRIHDLFQRNGLKTQVLAASFKNTRQILELIEYGVGASTATESVIAQLCKNETVDMAVDAFITDFESLCGDDQTMLTV